MKKILCTLLVLIASVVSAYATDGITAKDVTVPKGGSALLEIDMTNAVAYSSLSFDLVLPKGITATKIEKTSRFTDVEEKREFVLQMNNSASTETSETYTVLSFALPGNQGEPLQAIAGTSGAILFITLSAANDIQVSEPLEGKLSEIVMSTASLAQTKSKDASFTITIDSRFTLDENSTIAPNASNDPVDVRVLRTIKANEWSTICLPFAMTAAQVQAAFGDDVELADFSGCEAVSDTNDDIVGLNLKFSNATAIVANHPYVIKVSKPIEYEKGFTVDQVTINPSNTLSVDKDEFKQKLFGQWFYFYNSFIGTYEANTTLEAKSLFLSNNKFWYSAGNTKMKAFRAYFKFYNNLSEVDSYESRITMSFDDPTGINEVSVQEDDRYYNLSGQQVKPEKKGLYIQNGKKKIIK